MTWDLLLDPIAAEWFGDRCLILGFNGANEALVVKESGAITVAPIEHLISEWRYSWHDHRWHDVGVEEEALYDEEAADGSASVPGSISEADGDGDGDQGETDDGDLGNLDPFEEDTEISFGG